MQQRYIIPDITPARLEEIGFARRVTPIRGIEYWLNGMLTWREGHGVEFACHHLPHIDTMQQLQAACDALGIPHRGE